MSNTVSSLFLYSMIVIFCMFFSHPAIMLSCLLSCMFLALLKGMRVVFPCCVINCVLKKEKILQQTLIGSSCQIQSQSVSELKDFVKKLNSLPEMTVSIFYFSLFIPWSLYQEAFYMIIKLYLPQFISRGTLTWLNTCRRLHQSHPFLGNLTWNTQLLKLKAMTCKLFFYLHLSFWTWIVFVDLNFLLQIILARKILKALFLYMMILIQEKEALFIILYMVN